MKKLGVSNKINISTKNRINIFVIVVAFGISLVAASINFGRGASATSSATTNFLVPSASSSTTASNTNSYAYELSADGKYATVVTGSSNSILGTNAHNVGYELNITNGTSSPYVVSTDGVVGSPRAWDGGGAISETGRYVAFISNDTNLIDGTSTSGTNAQLYLRDTTAGTTTLLSQTSSGALANAPIDYVYGVSSDGRFVLFQTTATNLASNTASNDENFIMLDRSQGTFTILNLNSNGTDPIDSLYYPGSASMSCDGSLVAFEFDGNLNGSGSTRNVFLLDRRAGSILTNLTAGQSGYAQPGAPTISCNGDYVGYATNAESVDPNQPNTQQYYHAYVYDRINNTYTMIDQSSSGSAGNTNVADVGDYETCGEYGFGWGDSCVLLSDNGIATFSSSATNLVSSSVPGTNAYLRNINTGETDLITQPSSSSSNTFTPIGISKDGKEIVYESPDTGLVPSSTDTNNAEDAFLYRTGL